MENVKKKNPPLGLTGMTVKHTSLTLSSTLYTVQNVTINPYCIYDSNTTTCFAQPTLSDGALGSHYFTC